MLVILHHIQSSTIDVVAAVILLGAVLLLLAIRERLVSSNSKEVCH